MTSGSVELRFGTRGSALAVAQTDIVITALKRLHPDIVATPVIVQTEGDVDKTSPLSQIGGRGVFTSALEIAVQRGEIDAAVHSAKDLPTQISQDCTIVAFPIREDPRDVLISRHRKVLAELPANPVIGSSSKRRAVQLLRGRPDAKVVELRGNIDTRIRKALESELDAIVLAAAGVARMGWQEKITEYLSIESFVPSPGQGALAVEIRSRDVRSALLLADLDDPKSGRAVLIERAFLRAIGGGCTMPVGALATFDSGKIKLTAMVASDDGSRVEYATEILSPATAEGEAAELARRMAKAVGTSIVFVTGPATESNLPLRNRRVLITRAAEDTSGFADALIAAGAQPILLPTLHIEDVADSGHLNNCLEKLLRGEYDWVIFTSRNAVDRVLGRLKEPVPLATKFAAVGGSTASRIASFGATPHLIPKTSTAAALVDELTALGVEDDNILFPHGDLAPSTIHDGLSAAGATVDSVVAYRTQGQTKVSDDIINHLRNNEVNVITFLSPSSVAGFSAILEQHSLPFPRAFVACIGPVTATTARDAGIRVDVISSESSAPGLVRALIKHIGQIERENEPAGRKFDGR